MKQLEASSQLYLLHVNKIFTYVKKVRAICFNQWPEKVKEDQ